MTARPVTPLWELGWVRNQTPENRGPLQVVHKDQFHREQEMAGDQLEATRASNSMWKGKYHDNYTVTHQLPVLQTALRAHAGPSQSTLPTSRGGHWAVRRQGRQSLRALILPATGPFQRPGQDTSCVRQQATSPAHGVLGCPGINEMSKQLWTVCDPEETFR